MAGLGAPPRNGFFKRVGVPFSASQRDRTEPFRPRRACVQVERIAIDNRGCLLSHLVTAWDHVPGRGLAVTRGPKWRKGGAAQRWRVGMPIRHRRRRSFTVTSHAHTVPFFYPSASFFKGYDEGKGGERQGRGAEVVKEVGYTLERRLFIVENPRGLYSARTRRVAAFVVSAFPFLLPLPLVSLSVSSLEHRSSVRHVVPFWAGAPSVSLSRGVLDSRFREGDGSLTLVFKR